MPGAPWTRGHARKRDGTLGTYIVYNVIPTLAYTDRTHDLQLLRWYVEIYKDEERCELVKSEKGARR